MIFLIVVPLILVFTAWTVVRDAIIKTQRLGRRNRNVIPAGVEFQTADVIVIDTIQ